MAVVTHRVSHTPHNKSPSHNNPRFEFVHQ